MPKPLPRVPHVESPFVLRAELLTVLPHSMATRRKCPKWTPPTFNGIDPYDPAPRCRQLPTDVNVSKRHQGDRVRQRRLITVSGADAEFRPGGCLAAAQHAP